MGCNNVKRKYLIPNNLVILIGWVNMMALNQLLTKQNFKSSFNASEIWPFNLSGICGIDNLQRFT
jgi:hypothetical protein